VFNQLRKSIIILDFRSQIRLYLINWVNFSRVLIYLIDFFVQRFTTDHAVLYFVYLNCAFVDRRTSHWATTIACPTYWALLFNTILFISRNYLNFIFAFFYGFVYLVNPVSDFMHLFFELLLFLRCANHIFDSYFIWLRGYFSKDIFFVVVKPL